MASLRGAKYASLVVDDYSRYVFASFVSLKSDVVSAVKYVICHAENETGQKLAELHLDNGMEVVNEDMKKVFELNATLHTTTVPYTPQQNGIAEREIQSAFNAVRALLQDLGRPKFFGQRREHIMYTVKTDPHMPQYPLVKPLTKCTTVGNHLLHTCEHGVAWYITKYLRKSRPNWDPGQKRAFLWELLVKIFTVCTTQFDMKFFKLVM